ncbi:MAG TPA: 16S rRNA (guanine(527)-N(7))-methyltransferase RsmG [Chloroflexia bacterium]|nr:16S rRNA (guanine(527)-N(7))-methyltransferase RsmG [Chloroflexia bacterium]
MLEILQKEAREILDIELTAEQLRLFQLYYEELIDWNSRMNLTRITEYEAVQTRHFLDSLTLASPRLRGDQPGKALDLHRARLIDIGAGAGFPGIPLKILYPELKLTLVESVGKKITFLKHIATRLGFSEVSAINGRAEELGQDRAHREKYDLATGRAVAAWPVLAEYCLPFCRVGGLFVAPKKGDLQVELENSQAVAKTLGARMRETPVFTLPGEENDPRRLIVAEKIGRTSTLYPRRTGVPAQQPLDKKF